jgi:hypothetical protein
MNITFRRTLDDNKWRRWTHMLHRLILVQLTDQEDTFKWNLTTSGIFSVKIMYTDLLNDHTVFLKKVYLEDKGTAENGGDPQP